MSKKGFDPVSGLKLCGKCGQTSIAATHFHLGKSHGGYHSWCKSCCKAANQKSKSKNYDSIEARAKIIMRSCVSSAKKRKQDCDIDAGYIVDVWHEQRGVCAYSGRNMTLEHSLPNSISIERINSSIGYVSGNVVLVCNFVNKMKTNLPYKDFVEFCRDIAEFLYDGAEMVEGVPE